MPNSQPKLQPASVIRRFAAMLYDGILLFGLCFLGTLIALPLAESDAFSANNPLFSLYLLALCFCYLGYCWTKSGQTLGMQAWRIHLVNNKGYPPSWPEALKHFIAALLGYAAACITLTGYFVSTDKAFLHEKLSKLRLASTLK